MEGALNQGDQVKYETLFQAQDEISSLKAALSEKNSTLHRLISTHETLKTTSKAEIAKLESERRDLISALDEANLNKEEKESKIGAYKEEIQRLRSLLEESQKKCKETEKLAQTGKEVRKREELIISFEEEREKIQEKLKWKCEQFSHLEEAYKKSQLELKKFRRETEKEKSEFVSKISELETGLDSKSRLSEDLRSRLEMCNQALAREESKRKLLEVELREIQDRYNSVVMDFEAARLAIESVTQKRDADVASLRGILADKSSQIKEIEFQKSQVEQENKELRDSLKEYREIEIGGVEKSKKFKALEKKIRVRDLEIENLKKDLNNCLVKLNDKEIKNLEGGNWHEGCDEKIRVRDLEIENLKKDLNDCLVKLNEIDGLVEKIRVKDVEIENLKEDLSNCLVKLSEKDGLVEKIRVKEVEIENLKRDFNDCFAQLSDNDKYIEKIRVQEVEIENLKRDFDDCLAQLSNKDKLVGNLRNEFELSYSKLEEEKLVNKEELAVVLLVIKGNYEGHFEKNLKNDHEILVKSEKENFLKKELEDLVCQVRERDGLIGGLKECKEREMASVRENESLLFRIREREEVIEECKEREEALMRENESLLHEAREKEGVIEECKEREEALVRENESLLCEAREREYVVKEYKERGAFEKEKERPIFVHKERENTIEELKLCLERETAEKEKLICIFREREGVFEELEESKEREEVLERENENLGSVVRERDGEIEEMKEVNSRLELEIESLEEERKRYIEIGNELAKKLLEIKFKLDPLEGKYKKISTELEENLDLVVEALGNSNSECELMQLKLQEMISNYFLQEHEIQLKNGFISEMEMNLNSKEEKLEREKLENENRKIRFLNEIERLKSEKETLELQILDLHCGIGSVFCADGEIKAILENISQKMNYQEEIPKPNPPLRNKAILPVFGIRSPLKENNF